MRAWLECSVCVQSSPFPHTLSAIPTRAQGFYELDLNSWDVAAGTLLVTEAGGQVSGSEGEAFSLGTRHVVASNGLGDIHATLIELIARADAAQLRE